MNSYDLGLIGRATGNLQEFARLMARTRIAGHDLHIMIDKERGDYIAIAFELDGDIRSSSEWVPGQRRLRNWPLLRCLGGCDAAVTMNLALSSNSGLAATVFFPNDRPWHGRCFRNA